MWEISAGQYRPNLYPQRRRVRGCLTETDTGRQTGPRPGRCIGIDRLSPWQSRKNARFLATPGRRHTLSVYFWPSATGTQTDRDKSLPVLSGRKRRKKLLRRTGSKDRRNWIHTDWQGNDRYANDDASTSTEGKNTSNNRNRKNSNKGRKEKRDKRETGRKAQRKGSKKSPDSRQHSACAEK